jgi:hypothetical protein
MNESNSLKPSEYLELKKNEYHKALNDIFIHIFDFDGIKIINASKKNDDPSKKLKVNNNSDKGFSLKDLQSTKKLALDSDNLVKLRAGLDLNPKNLMFIKDQLKDLQFDANVPIKIDNVEIELRPGVNNGLSRHSKKISNKDSPKYVPNGQVSYGMEPSWKRRTKPVGTFHNGYHPHQMAMQEEFEETQILATYDKNVPGERPQPALEIKGCDHKKLQPEVYLNDTLISFYLRFIHNELIPEEKRKKVYVFNTYFLNKLRGSLRQNNDDLTTFDQIYTTMTKWAKTDLFEKDFVVIPLFEDEHWSLVIVCYPNRLYSNDNQVPQVLFFDSLVIIHPIYQEIIKRYLLCELQHKKKELFEVAQKKLQTLQLNVKYHQPMVLRQKNSYDCGLYMLQYAEMFLTDEKYILDNIQKDINRLRWFPATLVEDKRQIIRILIDKLRHNQPYLKDYLDYRDIRIKQATPDDYDVFNEQEFERELREKCPMVGLQNSFQNRTYLNRLKLDYYYNSNSIVSLDMLKDEID